MTYWNHTITNLPRNFIFGFGSIVNDESRSSTVEGAGDPIPVRISPEFGYRRVWNFQGSSAKLTALGLEKDPTKSSTINGIIYPIECNSNSNNIECFDQREEGYVRIKIPVNMIQAASWQPLPTHDFTVWVYIPKTAINNNNNNTPDKYYPILQTYVDTVLLGFLKYGEEYAIEFLYTTSCWNHYWLNDRQVPRRPWLFQKRYKEIDNLLYNYSKKYGLKDDNNRGIDIYPLRKLPVEFSMYFNCSSNPPNNSFCEINKSKCNEECTDLCF